MTDQMFLGVQLGYQGISVLQDLPSVDLDRAFAIVASAGFDHVEVMPDVVMDRPHRVTNAARGAGLSISGLHVFANEITDADELADTLQALGAPRVLITSHCKGWTHGDYLDLSTWLAKLADRLDSYGLQTYYHPHDVEFMALPGGLSGMDVITDNTALASVKFAVDSYWTRQGGRAPDAVIRELGDRTDYLHLKGNGDTSDFADALLAQDRSVPHFVVVEENEPEGDAEEFLRRRRDLIQQSTSAA